MLIKKTVLSVVLVNLFLFSGFIASAKTLTTNNVPLQVLIMEKSVPVVDAVLRERLAAQNINLVKKKISEPLTIEALRMFDLVVLPSFTGTLPIEGFWIYPHDILQRYLAIKDNLVLLQEYLAEGGGLLLIPSMRGGGKALSQSVNEFINPYGARLHPLQIRDPEHEYSRNHSWTTAVNPHPATENVHTIFYPHNMLRWDDAYSTPALTLENDDWTLLVRGMPDSAAALGLNYTEWEPTDLKAPAIAAVREVGKGRIGILTVNNFFVFNSPFAKITKGWIGESKVGEIDGIFMERGDGEKASDGFALLSGMLSWLGKSASQNGLGNYTEESFAALPQATLPPVPAWLKDWNPASGALPQRVLLGARSSFSDGKGTVAEYAKAAREAGYALLIFAETFEHFNSDRWDEFTSACAAAEDEKLAVIPGINIADQHGTRYLFFGRNMFLPKPELLTPDQKQIIKTQYFSLGLGAGTMVVHRPGKGLHHPHQLLKHYAGITISTYLNGKLVDDGLEAYAWQIDAFSNPMPFVVHELNAPEHVKAASSSGQQLYIMAPDTAAAGWWLGEVPGLCHFFEMPLPMQVSAGPIITEFMSDNFLRLESESPIREVLLIDNGKVIRRWTPETKTFTLPQVKLPNGHKAWTHLVAVDAEGNHVVSTGILSGRQSKWGFTWRCADRQNWTHPFISLYTGQEIFHFNVKVPGAAQSGDLAAVTDFALASWATYIQDSMITHCYPDAAWGDYARDGKPVPKTVPIEGYRGKVRFRQFFHPGTRVWNRPHPDNMPTLKEITLELLQPLKPQGAIFPQITGRGARTDFSGAPISIGSDLTYVYFDPDSGKDITGELTEGILDLPDGGRIGGLIALSDGLRVDTSGNVGFASPQDGEALLPVGTQWHASFVTIKPEEADHYRRMMGLAGATPYTLDLSQGKLERIHYVAYCSAEDGGLHGKVSTSWKDEYQLPVAFKNVNPNWDAVLWRPDFFRPIPIFEGEAWARLDVGKPGEFYMGHPLMSNVKELHLSLMHWSKDRIEFEMHNPTDETIEAEIWTAPAISDRKSYRGSVTVPAGSSRIINMK